MEFNLVSIIIRKGQGCLFQIFILTLLIYFSKENDKNLFVAFMDYQKALDFANRRNIISDLMKKGCGSQLTKAIANMYMVTEYLPKLKWNKLGDSIETRYGVTQGRKSSPTIFSFYVSDMPQSFDDIATSDFMDPYNLAQLADDTAIISETSESLINKVNAIFSFSESRYQIVNMKKTQYCNFNENPIKYPLTLDNNKMIQSVDVSTGYKYLGMLFFPTNDLKDIIMKNVNKRMCNVSKYYAWLEINKDTPVDTKLLVLDQCMFTALLYGAETWGDITFIENKILKIEIDLLRCILKVKTGTNSDLIYFELERADIISRMKDAQFKFINKLSTITHDEAVVKYIIEMCSNSDMIRYYNNLHGHNQVDNVNTRKFRIMNSDRSMISYYRENIYIARSCLYSSFIHDYFRYIITRWRLSNHKLKIETGRYTKPLTPRELRICQCCNVLEDENHAIFCCPRFTLLRYKYKEVLQRNNTVKKYLNPSLPDVKATAMFLHDIEKLLE